MAEVEKNKGGSGWIGMESTGLGSLNPKCHYEYQEIRGRGGGLASHPIHTPLDPPLSNVHISSEQLNQSL